MKAIIIYEGKVISKIPNLYKDNFGQVFTFHITNENTSAVDLTNKEVKFKAVDLTPYKDLYFEEPCVITTAENGYCTLTIPEGVLDEQGTFDCYLLITEDTAIDSKINLGHLNIW
jgi:hypothetical protein